MELSIEALGGLHLAADALRISDQCYTRLVDYAVQGALFAEGNSHRLREDPTLSRADSGVLKQAYYGLVTLFVEATKIRADPTQVQSILEDCKFSSERVAPICKMLEENRDQFVAHLKRITFHLPHIVDVDWRLDYCIKSNHLGKLNRPLYFIVLTTEVGGSKDSRQVTFTCTVEQLQDLVGRLKDAVKCWEKKTEDG